MRFNRTGYYIEEYIKCSNCGELIYDPTKHPERGRKEEVFCSDWCAEWRRLRESGESKPILPLPRVERSGR